jgi:hypothetical protein
LDSFRPHSQFAHLFGDVFCVVLVVADAENILP